jgi:hypothetical protein
MKHNPEIILKVLLAIGPILPLVPYLCNAAEKAARMGLIRRNEERAFKTFIHERIDGYYTVMSWLKDKHGIDYAMFPYERRLAYRQLWLQNLIEEFSK